MARRSGVGLEESVHDHAALEERLLHVKITRKSLNQLLSKSSLLMKSSSSKQTLVSNRQHSSDCCILIRTVRQHGAAWPICASFSKTGRSATLTHLPEHKLICLSSVELVRSYRQDENHLDP